METYQVFNCIDHKNGELECYINLSKDEFLEILIAILPFGAYFDNNDLIGLEDVLLYLKDTERFLEFINERNCYPYAHGYILYIVRDNKLHELKLVSPLLDELINKFIELNYNWKI